MSATAEELSIGEMYVRACQENGVWATFTAAEPVDPIIEAAGVDEADTETVPKFTISGFEDDFAEELDSDVATIVTGKDGAGRITTITLSGALATAAILGPAVAAAPHASAATISPSLVSASQVYTRPTTGSAATAASAKAAPATATTTAARTGSATPATETVAFPQGDTVWNEGMKVVDGAAKQGVHLDIDTVDSQIEADNPQAVADGVTDMHPGTLIVPTVASEVAQPTKHHAPRPTTSAKPAAPGVSPTASAQPTATAQPSTPETSPTAQSPVTTAAYKAFETAATKNHAIAEAPAPGVSVTVGDPLLVRNPSGQIVITRVASVSGEVQLGQNGAPATDHRVVVGANGVKYVMGGSGAGSEGSVLLIANENPAAATSPDVQPTPTVSPSHKTATAVGSTAVGSSSPTAKPTVTATPSIPGVTIPTGAPAASGVATPSATPTTSTKTVPSPTVTASADVAPGGIPGLPGSGSVANPNGSPTGDPSGNPYGEAPVGGSASSSPSPTPTGSPTSSVPGLGGGSHDGAPKTGSQAPTSPYDIITHPDSVKDIPSSVQQLGGVVYYSQYDPRWTWDAYHGVGGSGDIGSSGCGATSLAMVISTFSHQMVTPEDIAKYNMEHGFVTPNGASTYNAAMLHVPEAYGLKSYQIGLDRTSVENVFKAGGLVIIDGTKTSSMNFPTPATSAGHFYVIRAMNAAGGWLIANPDDTVPLSSGAESNNPWNPDHILTPADAAYAIFPGQGVSVTHQTTPTHVTAPNPTHTQPAAPHTGSSGAAPTTSAKPTHESYPTNYSIYDSATSMSGLTVDQLNHILAGTDLAGLGQAFHNAEQQYGINALFMVEHAGIESTWGSSQIAQAKNNLFGYGADDAHPFQDAYTFKSFADCIYYYAAHMKANYLTPGGPFYNGTSYHGIFVDYSSSHDSEAHSIVDDMNRDLAKVGGPHASTTGSGDSSGSSSSHKPAPTSTPTPSSSPTAQPQPTSSPTDQGGNPYGESAPGDGSGSHHKGNGQGSNDNGNSGIPGISLPGSGTAPTTGTGDGSTAPTAGNGGTPIVTITPGASSPSTSQPTDQGSPAAGPGLPAITPGAQS